MMFASVRRSINPQTEHTSKIIAASYSTLRDPQLPRPCAVATREGLYLSRAIGPSTLRQHVCRNAGLGSKPDRSHNAPYAALPDPSAGIVISSITSLSIKTEIAAITILNPTKLNILNSQLLEDLIAACESLHHRSQLRAVVLTSAATAVGKPPSFIGGADIKEMHALNSSFQARAFITLVHQACAALRSIPVPVIARVHGLALGAGLEIMASCDLRIATSTSTFGMPEVRVGIPSVVEAALLPGLIGMGRTRRLLYLGEMIGAEEAERWGLLEKVVKGEGELDGAVDECVGKLCEAGPRAIKSQKMLIQRWENSSLADGIEAGIRAFEDAYNEGAEEPRAMMSNFLERRKS